MCNSNNSLFLNIDLLRFMPPCRVNRDENNRQKTIMINGGERLRISSQCIKAGLRNLFGFNDCVDIDDLKEKIKNYKDNDPNESFYLSEKLVKDICGFAKETKKATSKKGKKKNADTESAETENVEDENSDEEKNESEKGKNVVLYISLKELHHLYSLSSENKKGNWIKEFENNNTFDMDFFGRMYASKEKSDFNKDAVCQVSHAISVQDVEIVDDNWVCRNPIITEDGCITMGDSGIGSSLMYFNSNLNITELLKRGYSKDQIIHLVSTFVIGFYALRLNSGVNGTAHNTLPVYCNVTVGNIAPYNHSDVFYKSLDHDSSVDDAIDPLKNKIENDNLCCKEINTILGVSENNVESIDDFIPIKIGHLKDILNKMIKNE